MFSYSCCSVAKSCLTLCDPMDCATPDFPALPYLPALAQTYKQRVKISKGTEGFTSAQKLGR